MIKYILAMGVVAIWFLTGRYLEAQFTVHSARSIIFAYGGPAFYIFLGHFIRPTPDMNNMGWFGGIVNNPFSYADDVNRFKFGLTIALLPGQLLAAPFAAIAHSLSHDD